MEDRNGGTEKPDGAAWRSEFDESDAPAEVPPPRWNTRWGTVKVLAGFVPVVALIVLALFGFARRYVAADGFSSALIRPALSLVVLILLVVGAVAWRLRRRS